MNIKKCFFKRIAIITTILYTAVNYLGDVGNRIAVLLDSKDKRPNNGYIDFY